ncbi:MAG TPA: sugar ABC transporter permease [Blastococcus sp.]|jgi:multiple sugar transport system permease protein|nr:sugar ABC transporter permease [Blastococcus sp.]
MTSQAGIISTEAAEAARPGGPPRKRRRLEADHNRRALLLLGPTVLLLMIVILYPVVRGVIMSFQNDPGLDPATGLFVSGGFAGLDNYTHWLGQQCGRASCPPGTLGSQFYSALFVTIFFTVVSVAIEVVLGMWFALIMNRTFRGRGLVRASILVPWAIPTAVTAKLWFFILSFAGIANSILHTQILWTGSTWPARSAIIIADAWKTTPFMALLILAGLQVIPADVYEAARVDGATKWQQFRLITLPLVKPALMVAVLFRTLDVLRIYDLPKILTGGGNGTTTLSILVVDQIRQGFNSAAALSTITFLLIFLVAFLFVRFLGANVAASSGKAK